MTTRGSGSGQGLQAGPEVVGQRGRAAGLAVHVDMGEGGGRGGLGVARREQGYLVGHRRGADAGHPQGSLDRVGEGEARVVGAARPDSQADDRPVQHVQRTAQQPCIHAGIHIFQIDHVIDVAEHIIIPPTAGHGLEVAVLVTGGAGHRGLLQRAD